MINFLHKLLNPHCPDCIHEKECKSCEILRELLATEQYNNKQLLNSILEYTSPKKEETRAAIEIPQPISKAVSWRVRQQMLEQEDRIKAGLMKQKLQEEIESKKSTDELEKEVGINNAG